MVAKCHGTLENHGVRAVHCRDLPYYGHSYLQKNSVKWEHVPCHFSTCKPNSCYLECKLRVPIRPAVKLAAEMQ